MTRQRKAVALISGGLDSLLAAQLMLDQGIHVEGLNFYTGFCHSGHTSAVRKTKRQKPKRNDALWVAEQLGIKLHIVDIVDEYKNVLTQPKYDYGKHINPCLDCKIFMVRKAHEWMADNGFDFIVTGEVVGQRPKSQRKNTMPMVAKRSGAAGLLLRPLSAQNLEPTLPEIEGWVDRDRLQKLGGRGRKPQIELAKHYGFDDYAQPSGGCCVLTDENYARKLKDMWDNNESKDYELDDIILLKIGRHLRPNPRMKLIIGREEGENNFLRGYRRRFIAFEPVDKKGPLVLVDGQPTADDLQLASQVAARYCLANEAGEVALQLHKPGQPVSKICYVKPMAPDAVQQEWYL
jgi:tRNA-uridine 2-sulfurtransferase